MIELQLGERSYDLTHHALVMGILNRTPDSFYDKGADVRPRRAVQAGRAAGRGRRRPLGRRGSEGGPGTRGHRGRGARTRGRCDRHPGRPVRCADLGRHLAGPGGQGVLRGRRRARQRHQRVRRPRLPLRCGGGRGERRRDPHPLGPAGRRPRARLWRSRDRRRHIPERPGNQGARGGLSHPPGS